MRAARVLWAKILKGFGAKNPKSMALRTHSQTSGWSLTEQDPVQQHCSYCYGSYVSLLWVIPNPCILTHLTKQLHCRPTSLHVWLVTLNCIFKMKLKSARLSIKWAVPTIWYLTNEIIRRAWAHIQEVEALGGMAKAIATGLPKMRIEECGARRQANIDSGKETIVGLNKYRLAKEDPLNVLSIDNTAVRNAQIKRLEKLES